MRRLALLVLLLAQAELAAGALVPRVPFPKPSREELEARQHDDQAILKFAEGTGIRLREGDLVVVASEIDLQRGALQGLTQAILEAQTEVLSEILDAANIDIERLLTNTEANLKAHRIAGETKSGRQLADLNLFFAIRFPGQQPSDVVDVLSLLNALEIVEYAAPTVKGAPPPTDTDPPTPSFTANQTYFAPAPSGIDVAYARALPGGRGETLRIIDVENGWNADHEDFPPLVSASGVNYQRDREHGTAVVGALAAVENHYGMTGIAPAVEISFASPVTAPNDAYNLPDGVERAIQQSRSGDLILIEQSVFYNYPADQMLCPPEYDPAVFAVVETAVANGRIVIETAGNSTQNLDDTNRFGDRFQRSIRDSGAIYVGAGQSNNHVPMGYTNYGSRIDMQGWGENIATLGYGALFYPNNDRTQSYTGGFNGTSGAAPIVTGAAAIIQSVRRARGLSDLTSQQMRTALLIGATPQGPGVNIGPLPDLRDALAAVPVPAPTIAARGVGASATITWNAVPGVSGYEIFRRAAHNGPWTSVGTTSSATFADSGVEAGKAYLYSVRSFDAHGTRSAESNRELATTIAYSSDAVRTQPVRAKHVIELRRAVNAICAYAGAAICPTPPFAAAALDEATVKTQPIKAGDFTALQNHIGSLRSVIGASPYIFSATPAAGTLIRELHIAELREGAN